MNALALTPHRTYETTHPWLSFSAGFTKRIPAQTWMILGECRSKCDHIAGVPLEPSRAKELYEIYLAKGALATTAIEGNTLSEREVLEHLEGKLKLPPSREYLAQEIDNIIKACNSILEEVRERHALNLSPQRIRELNRVVLENLALEQGVVPGEIRQHEVTVARYRGAPREDCECLLDRLCEWLGSREFLPEIPEMLVPVSILKAILSHVYLAWIHPFGDGNGRTARLVEFQILISSGVPAPAAHLLSNHYNQTRAEYYRQLDLTSRSGGDLIPFVNYALQGFLEGLKQQLSHVRREQWEAAWRDFVHDAFKGESSPMASRQLTLILELSKMNRSVPLLKLPEMSPQLTLMYAGKTKKTLVRDVNALTKRDLVARDREGVRARKETILAFLPVKAEAVTCETNS